MPGCRDSVIEDRHGGAELVQGVSGRACGPDDAATEKSDDILSRRAGRHNIYRRRGRCRTQRQWLGGGLRVGWGSQW